MFHKPCGLITTRMPEGERGSVYDGLPQWVRDEGFVPVGRLDKETQGLLLFLRPEDGKLHHRLLVPGSCVKQYEVSVRGQLASAHKEAMLRGVSKPTREAAAVFTAIARAWKAGVSPQRRRPTDILPKEATIVGADRPCRAVGPDDSSVAHVASEDKTAHSTRFRRSGSQDNSGYAAAPVPLLHEPSASAPQWRLRRAAQNRPPVRPPPPPRISGLRASEVYLPGELSEGSRLTIHLREGKNKHVRRMIGWMNDFTTGLPLKVLELHRVSVGPIRLDIPVGEWRFLSSGEVATLLSFLDEERS